MNYQFFYVFFMVSMFALSIAFFASAVRQPQAIGYKPSLLDTFKKHIFRTFDEDYQKRLMSQSGMLRFNLLHYQFVRYMLTLALLLFYMANYFFQSTAFPINAVLFLIAVFLLSTPKEYAAGKKTPFKIVFDFLIANKKQKMNLEIIRAFSLLKNIAIIKKDNPPGAQFVLEQLRKFTKETRPAFNKMMAIYSLGKKAEATEYFSQAIGTKEAENLASILRKIDDLNPAEFLEQIEYYQESIRRERESLKQKQNENRSNLIFLVVFVSSITVLINFVIVVYYIETINSLKFIF